MPAVAVLDTVMLHSAVWPCVKFPEWVFVTASTADGKMVTLSVLEVVFLAPPPLTERYWDTRGGVRRRAYVDVDRQR